MKFFSLLYFSCTVFTHNTVFLFFGKEIILSTLNSDIHFLSDTSTRYKLALTHIFNRPSKEALSSKQKIMQSM